MVVRLFLAGVCVGSRAQHWFQCVVCATIFQVRRAIGSPIAWTACGGRRVLRLRLRLRLPCDAAAFFGLAQMVMLQHDEGASLTQT